MTQKIETPRAALARSAITNEIAAWYLRQQKGGRRGLRRALRSKREIYLRAVLANVPPKEVKRVRALGLQTWRRQLVRVTGKSFRAFCDIRLDQLSLFEETAADVAAAIVREVGASEAGAA